MSKGQNTIRAGQTMKPTRAFVLWHRRDRRHGWKAVAESDTRRGAIDLIGIGDRNDGDWLVCGPFEPKPPCTREPLTIEASTGPNLFSEVTP